jgi:hypothetical protein
MAKRNIIQEMEKGLFDKTTKKEETNSIAGKIEVFKHAPDPEELKHRTESSTIGYYFYDYTNKVNDPVEDKAEFGPFESYDDVYGIFSFTSGKLYALSNNPKENLFINSEEYGPFQKVPVTDGDVLKIAEFQYVVSDQQLFLHQNAKKVMGKLLVKKSTSGTQKALEERQNEIILFESKIYERQQIVQSLEAQVQKVEDNKQKAIELKLKIKKWIQEIDEAKRVILVMEKENSEISRNDFQKEIDLQENEIRRLQETKSNLVEKANIAKERLIKMQVAEEKKKAQINSELLDIEREKEALEKKLIELEKKKSKLED